MKGNRKYEFGVLVSSAYGPMLFPSWRVYKLEAGGRASLKGKIGKNGKPLTWIVGHRSKSRVLLCAGCIIMYTGYAIKSSSKVPRRFFENPSQKCFPVLLRRYHETNPGGISLAIMQRGNRRVKSST